MIIGFEKWLRNHDVQSEAKELFEESIICYKALAYRASLLFSFLGFQTIIKHRIIKSKAAKDYSDGEWDQIRRELQNDDLWDKKIISLISNKKKPIFNISEDLRDQYNFWKNRRNDCAHAKGNTISYPHVESFWLFIQSNLTKFVVHGGMKFILEEISDYYNPVFTPPETPIDPIVQQIPTAIEIDEYSDFLTQLKSFTLERYPQPFKVLDDEIAKVWYRQFELPEVYCEILIEFLTEESGFCLDILRRKSSIIRYFHGRETFIRELWRSKFKVSDDYKILISLLRNKLIPRDQLEEAYEHVFNTIDSDIFGTEYKWNGMFNDISDIDKLTLIQQGFFKTFYEKAFVGETIAHNFNWGNRNKEIVMYYISQIDLDEKIVNAINNALDSAYPPFKLRDELEELYTLKPHLLEKHIEICQENTWRVPDMLKYLSEQLSKD